MGKYALEKYYILYLRNIKQLKESSIKHYLDAIKYISNHLTSKGKIRESLYEIHDLDELEDIREYLKKDVEFVALDERGHRMYTAGLNNYCRFASGENFADICLNIDVLDIEVTPESSTERIYQYWRRSSIDMSYGEELQIDDEVPKIKPLSLTELKKLWAFEENGDGIVLTDYKGEEEKIIIPDAIGDKKVVGLGDYLFSPEKPKRMAKRKPYFSTSIKSIIVPDDVVEIGSRAFLNCEGLREVKLSKREICIGKEAFRGCDNLANTDGLIVVNDVLYGYSKQTIKENVIIPDGVTTIGDRAFFECPSIKKVVLPQSAKIIGVSSFGECLALQEIDIPSSVCEIGNGAFFHCKELNILEIPEALKKISDDTFMKCIQLKKVVIPKNVSQIGVWAFNQCNRLEEVVIECDDVEIGQWAFNNCAKLTVSVVNGSATQERVKEAGIPFKEI